jgi:DNA polymerase I-like protein with 3'-5' exonuclease and polymerase domains
MEVSMLQWLTKDEKLGKIINSGRDLYSVIYSLVSGSSYSENKETRKLIKNALLPIMYGVQEEKLAEITKISVGGARLLIEKVQQHFGTAMKWLEEVQEKAKTETTEDYFGRPRKQENYWAARNMVVQSPAAVVCLEKLIKLHEHLKNVVMSIHDAYILTVDHKDLRDFSEAAVAILESPSELCSNLRLKTECKFGTNLAELKLINE